MRDDHKRQLKSIKQQIRSFGLRHGLKSDTGKSNWTIAHLKWLRSLEKMLGLTADHYPVGNQSTYIRVTNAGI